MAFSTTTAAIIVLPMAAPAQSIKCGNFLLLDDTVSKEQRARTLLDRGATCVREGKPLQLIAIFSELIGLQSNNTIAYLNRGNAYLQSGQFELDIADFSHIISVEPKMTEAWYNRGTGFIAGRQYEQAIADLTEAIRLKPGLARHTATVASPSCARATTTEPWRIWLQAFNWTRTWRSATTRAARSTSEKAITGRQSTISPRA